VLPETVLFNRSVRDSIALTDPAMLIDTASVGIAAPSCLASGSGVMLETPRGRVHKRQLRLVDRSISFAIWLTVSSMSIEG
jgi:hypothetical protein